MATTDVVIVLLFGIAASILFETAKRWLTRDTRTGIFKQMQDDGGLNPRVRAEMVAAMNDALGQHSRRSIVGAIIQNAVFFALGSLLSLYSIEARAFLEHIPELVGLG